MLYRAKEQEGATIVPLDRAEALRGVADVSSARLPDPRGVWVMRPAGILIRIVRMRRAYLSEDPEGVYLTLCSIATGENARVKRELMVTPIRQITLEPRLPARGYTWVGDMVPHPGYCDWRLDEDALCRTACFLPRNE